MNKVLVFDMDGTIADLYGVDGWLEMLRAEDTTPYAKAKPMYDMDALNFILYMLKNAGYKVVVTTWLAKDSSKDFERKTATVKKKWLDDFNFPYDMFYPISYGVEKSLSTKNLGGVQYLIDDNADVRKTWSNGFTINAQYNILEALTRLLG